MIGICIESSHARGMGHLYRMLNLVEYLRSCGQGCMLMMNDNLKSRQILVARGIDVITVNLEDVESDWEAGLIKRYGLTVWINDRLDTNARHAVKVVAHGVKLVTFDDRGDGALFADLHFAPLVFSGREALKGNRVHTGTDYLILNSEIDRYKRVRSRIDSILVTLGGSDTYGVTLRIVRILHELGVTATIITGPSFVHNEELEEITVGAFTVIKGVPSLIEEFSRHDLAMTGGGMTPFEANASGLPCIIVANELHEIEVGQYLQTVGSSTFAGYYKSIDKSYFSSPLDIEKMSKAGMAAITTDGVTNVFREISAL